jgi:hypothetical protein
MSRGIFKKQNGQWKRVVAPSYKVNGEWHPITKGFVKKDGIWQQFFPSDVLAKILVVGGGGGGGMGYGWEGGGGGGAGGVIYKENVKLSVLAGAHYTVTVGAGGSINESGGYSMFGTGSIVSQNTSVPTVYAGTYPVYNGFLNTYGVWTSPDFVNPVNTLQQVVYTTNLAVGGRYTVRASADNEISVYINGNPVVSNADWGSYNDGAVDISSGPLTITVNAVNRDSGSPGLFAAALYNPSGSVVWHTRSPLTEPTKIENDGFTALGGGNGGWGTPEQTAGSGASGGGGCGYVNTHGGGAGYPGQGHNGGVGSWQGYGQAGGGGGGGFAGTGQGSNGNFGGNGGPGITYLGFAVGGGGGGGYGNQSSDGDGGGGLGGAGGGGNGNGGNGIDGTGGGGGGGLHGAHGNAGRGGAGLVVVQYLGNSAFTGGEIYYENGVTTHIFHSTSALLALE